MHDWHALHQLEKIIKTFKINRYIVGNIYSEDATFYQFDSINTYLFGLIPTFVPFGRSLTFDPESITTPENSWPNVTGTFDAGNSP